MDYAALKVLKRLNIEPKEVRKTAYQGALSLTPRSPDVALPLHRGRLRTIGPTDVASPR